MPSNDSKPALSHWRPDVLLKKFTEIDDTPHAIALGSAIGMFWGFTPLYGLKTLLCLGTARLTRGHMVAAVIMVTLQDVFLPVMPFLVEFELKLGERLLGRPVTHFHPPHHFNPQDLLHWTTYFDEGLPLLIGSLPVGFLAGILTYVLVYFWDGGRKAARKTT